MVFWRPSFQTRLEGSSIAGVQSPCNGRSAGRPAIVVATRAAHKSGAVELRPTACPLPHPFPSLPLLLSPLSLPPSTLGLHSMDHRLATRSLTWECCSP